MFGKARAALAIALCLLLSACGAANGSAVSNLEPEQTQTSPPAVAQAGTGESDMIGLKDLYADDFLIGAAVNAASFAGAPFELLKRHHNIVTPENAMKPANLFLQGASSMDKVNTSAADILIKNAVEAGFLIHGHTLVWHSQSAAWLNTKTENGQKVALDADTARANMRAFITFTVRHFADKAAEYGGRLVSYDVVNEAFSDERTAHVSPDGGWKDYLRGAEAASGAAVSGDPAWWYFAIGDTYIEEAFLLTWETEPTVKRYYNDYNLDSPGKAQAVANMVRDINDRYREQVGGNLIQGVGMQGHYSLDTKIADVERSIRLFADLGVDVSFSELDVMIERYNQPMEATPERLARQAKLYGDLFALFRRYAANIERVTLWGLDDNTSWRREYSPLLFDGKLNPKPAFDAVAEAGRQP